MAFAMSMALKVTGDIEDGIEDDNVTCRIDMTTANATACINTERDSTLFGKEIN